MSSTYGMAAISSLEGALFCPFYISTRQHLLP